MNICNLRYVINSRYLPSTMKQLDFFWGIFSSVTALQLSLWEFSSKDILSSPNFASSLCIKQEKCKGVRLVVFILDIFTAHHNKKSSIGQRPCEHRLVDGYGSDLGRIFLEICSDLHEAQWLCFAHKALSALQMKWFSSCSRIMQAGRDKQRNYFML